VSKIEQSGRSSLRRPKLPIKGGSGPEEEEEEEGRRRKKKKKNKRKTMMTFSHQLSQGCGAVSLGYSFQRFRRCSSFIFKGETILDLVSLRLLRMTELDPFQM